MLPDDRVQARKLQHLATIYTLFRDMLYKKSYFRLHFDPYLRSLSSNKARKVMQEIYNGNCENHVGGLFLAHKVINQGYYWPKMFEDAKDYVKKCQQYQRFTPALNKPSTDLHTLRCPWLFMQWGLDIVGPLP